MRPVWFSWEDEAFWWLTDADSRLADDSAAALVADTCDLDTGTVLQVTANGRADVMPLERDRAVRKLTRHLGTDSSTRQELRGRVARGLAAGVCDAGHPRASRR